MGGIAVHMNHETNIRDLYAVGECASMYHGANRLGGNSLLSAIYGGWTAAEEIAGREAAVRHYDFSGLAERESAALMSRMETESRFPVMYIRDMLSETMNEKLGIVRDQPKLTDGLADIDYYLSVADKINYDPAVMPYFNYSLTGILTLSKSILTCALSRTESRGAHYRTDFSERDDAHFKAVSTARYDGAKIVVTFEKVKGTRA